MRSILWCTSHYTKDFCQRKAKELRDKIKNHDPEYLEFKSVSLVDKVTDLVKINGEFQRKQYNRIRLYYK